MDRNSHSPGICQKLINFFLLRLRPLPASAGIPVKKGSSIAGVDAEIAVDFRHTDEKGSSIAGTDAEIAVDFRHTGEHKGYSIHSHEKDGLISGDRAKLQNGSERNGFRARSGGVNGPKKTVAIKGKSDHQEILVHDRHSDDHETKLQRPTQHWPLRSVVSNIDEKSGEFIDRKKRELEVAMGMNYSLDPKS